MVQSIAVDRLRVWTNRSNPLLLMQSSITIQYMTHSIGKNNMRTLDSTVM